MSKAKTLFQSLNDSSDAKVLEIIFKLFKSNKLNYGLIDKAYDMYLKSSNIEKILEKVKKEKILRGHELSELFKLNKDDIYDLFKTRTNDNVNISDFPLFFEKMKIYEIDDIFSSKEMCKYIFDSLRMLNIVIKNESISLSKTSFYKYKSAILKKMYQIGYMKECHKEVRDDEAFYSVSFSIDDKTYYFHQTSKSFFADIDKTDDNDVKSYEHENSEITEIDETDINERATFIKYVYLRYLKFN